MLNLSLSPLLPVYSLPPLSFCSWKLAQKHTQVSCLRTETKQIDKRKNHANVLDLPSQLSFRLSSLSQTFSEWLPFAASIFLPLFQGSQESLWYESSGHFGSCHNCVTPFGRALVLKIIFSPDCFKIALLGFVWIFPFNTLIAYFVESSLFAPHGMA